MSQFKFLAVVLLIKLNLYITTLASLEHAQNQYHHARIMRQDDRKQRAYANKPSTRGMDNHYSFDSNVETTAAAMLRILSRASSSTLDDKLATISNNNNNNNNNQVVVVARDDKIDDLFHDQQHTSTATAAAAATIASRQADSTSKFNEEKLSSGGVMKPSVSSSIYNTINLDNSIEEPEMFTNNHQSTSSANVYLPDLPQNGAASLLSTPQATALAASTAAASSLSGYNSRQYHQQSGLAKNPYHTQNYHVNYPYQNHNYPSKLHYLPNMFANNYNLNYIHSLLTSKPTPPQPPPSSQLLNIPADLLTSNPNRLTLGAYGSGGFASAYISASSALSAAVNNLHLSITQNQQQMSSSNQYSSSLSDKLSSSPQSSSSSSSTDAPQPELTTGLTVNASIGDLPGSSICGRQQVAAYREPRVVGGNNTYEGEFPWAVSIQRHGNHHCGGVIVGPRWILTAAHCVRSQLVSNLIVRTGGHTLTRSANSLNGHMEKDYQVEQIVMHDDFSRYDNLTISQLKSSANTNNADIALLKLKHEILWNELAWPVCFPNREAGNFSGHDATVIGWGKLNEKSEEFSNELQKVKLTIIDNKVCQNWFRQAGRDMPIDDRIICAGFKSGGKDACHGDSGGPLLSRINGQYVVVGVVSTGIGCARPLLPGLYSRVSSYINWIERYITS